VLALVHPAVGFPQQRGGVGGVARMAVPVLVLVLVRCSSGSASGCVLGPGRVWPGCDGAAPG
jgi:hypothetical protein